MRSNRPLSPHLQVYKLPLTGLISITHRITGVFLCLGLAGYVIVLLMIANSPETYTQLQGFAQQGLVKWMYGGFIAALCFHVCHGIRHLLWDTGKSFDKHSLQRAASFELSAFLLLTVMVLVFF